MKKSLITLTTIMILSASMSITSWAMTAEEVTAKNPTSYTAGTNSIYGPKLTQDQLSAVAQATADFMTANITDSMSTDDKIKAAYDYIKTRTTYVDWNAVTGANTAYTLVTGQGACSGMCRSMKALCDAMGIECYHVHSTSNDHQWNLVRYGDGILYHVDIDANKSAGQDIIYKSLTHPLPFDTSAYPAVGALEQTANNGWKEESGKWYYYENGAKAVNKWINGLYYVGSDGAMLVNTTTPDGYQVGADGAWIKSVSQNGIDYTGTGIRSWQSGAESGIWTNEEGKPLYYAETKYTGTNLENSCNVIDTSVMSFQFKQNLGNINPEGHSVEIVAVKPNGFGSWWTIGEGKKYPFEYGKNYSFNCTDMSDINYIKFCQDNDIMIVVYVYDDTVKDAVEKDYPAWFYSFATSKSVPTGEIG